MEYINSLKTNKKNSIQCRACIKQLINTIKNVQLRIYLTLHLKEVIGMCLISLGRVWLFVIDICKLFLWDML